MIPAVFDYIAAESAEEALATLAEHGDEAKLLAGGHSLIPLLKFRFAAPSVLVDIGRIDDLSYIREDNGHIAIGALSTHQDVESSAVLKQGAPMLAHVASQIGDPSVRHRGTIGGSLAHGDPASDLPAALLALGGSVVAQGPNGAREIAATDLFTSFLETALEPDELLTEIRVPKAAASGPGKGWSYQKFNRRAQDWAIVAAAVQLGDEPRVALVNMATTPVRSSAVEAALGSGGDAAGAAALAAEGMSPPEDLNGDAEYRGHLASVLVERAITAASQ